MSAVAGVVGVALVLIAEDILIGSKNGPSATQGIFGGVARTINSIASPDVPAIPNRADKGK